MSARTGRLTPSFLTPRRRAWVYRVALAALPLLIAYGVLDDARAPLWIALVGAIVVPGLAADNTDTTPPEEN